MIPKSFLVIPCLALLALSALVFNRNISAAPHAPDSNWTSQKPGLPETDRIRLAEAFRLADQLGNKVWVGWDKAPFAVLLVTSENEFLVRHPRPSSDFVSLGYDHLLKSEVYFRKRSQPVNFLATFPLVGGISTIVIGQAENTEARTSTSWVVTVFHEHLHQLQDSQPDYHKEIEALGLTGGDQTGMWMLNYPFPYSTPEVKQQFAVLSRLLAETIQTVDQKEFSSKFANYLSERQKLKKILCPADYKYLSFQLWKEGVSRYTEYRIAQMAAKDYQPSKEFQSLKDYTPFKEVAESVKNKTLRQLTTLQLDEYRREAFYPFGAGEALLLDRVNPKWQDRYFVDKFDAGDYFEEERNSVVTATTKPLVKIAKLPSGLKLQYAEQGNESGVPVILLHGYTDSWRSFELVLPHLPKSIRAFALSQRGHGDSSIPSGGYYPQDFANDVASFMDEMKLKRAIIVGHSMGSQVALRFALDHPERTHSLVLIGAFKTVKGNAGAKQLWDTTIAKMTDPIDSGFVRDFQQSTLHKPVPREFLNAVVQESTKVPARVWKAVLTGLMDTDFSAELGKINVATLIVWGDQDSFVQRGEQEALSGAIKGSKLVTYAGAGHAPHWEMPERFAAELTAFVGQVKP